MTIMNRFTKDSRSGLLDQLIMLRAKIEDAFNRFSATEKTAAAYKSKQNLAAYLTLQKHADETLNSNLAAEGLSSLQLMTPHVLHSMNQAIKHLSLKEGYKREGIDFTQAVHLKNERNKQLFGALPDGSTPVMVTLDKSMLDTPDIFKEFLQAGMNIARINLARDPLTWKNLIEHIRHAEAELNTDRRCIIYADLPGPKIRVSDLEKLSNPYRINIAKTPSGYLLSNQTKEFPFKNAFHIQLNIDKFINVSAGDKIYFTDENGEERYFTIIKVLNSSCLKVELNQSAVLTKETKVRMNEKESYRILGSRVTIKVKEGDIVRIYKNADFLGKPATDGDPASVGITLPEALKSAKSDDKVFFDDGVISGLVKTVTDEYLDVEITFTKNKTVRIKPQKGINLPRSSVGLNVSAITEADIDLLPQILPYVDLIGLSFVHRPDEVKILADYIKQNTKRKIGIIAKIETKDALNNLAEILLEGLNFGRFGIMIARGDLAIEAGYKSLAHVQEKILEMCKAAHIPVIWATGVLDHMNKKGLPLRAELTDAFMGLRADCIMLNKGDHVADSIRLLKRIEKINNESKGLLS